MSLFNPVILFTLLFQYSFLTQAGGINITEEAKILHLLERIEDSNATFLRNDKPHTSKEARKHLEMKYNNAKSRFFFFPVKVTVKKFIEKIASKSSMSGKDYVIILPNKKKFKAKDWLYKELKVFLSKYQK